MNTPILQRAIVPRLVQDLRVMPVVVVSGARQTGKSTLVRQLLEEDRPYYSLDDLDVLDLVERDPDGLVGGEDPVTIDEVQRAPELLLAVKRAVDSDRRPGRFLLTGSANLLLMKNVSESLAGRAGYVNLRPMTRREQSGNGSCGIWETLIETPDDRWHDLLVDTAAPEGDWRKLATRGGFPVPAVHMQDEDSRRIWFDGYVQTYLERDLRELSSVQSLPDFRRLMRAACHRIGQLVNQTELGRDVGLPQPTVHRYLNLLETSFVLIRLPAYAVNRTKRLIKSPKLYWADTGLALSLSGHPEPAGAHLENLILTELLVWRDVRRERCDLFYWRTTTGEEVDFVIETADRLIPIEVKASTRTRVSDAGNLRLFRSEYGMRSRSGLILYSGSEVRRVTPDVLAVPWWKVV